MGTGILNDEPSILRTFGFYNFFLFVVAWLHRSCEADPGLKKVDRPDRSQVLTCRVSAALYAMIA